MDRPLNIETSRLKLTIAFLAGLSVASAAVFLVGVFVEQSFNGRATAAGATQKVAAKIAQSTRPDPFEMVQALRQGGYILYFRHPERQKWDSVIAFDVWEAASGEDAAKQSYQDAVCLTPRGKEEALMMGKILKASHIPVGTVISSPICRARQAAQLAFGHIDAIEYSLIHTPVVNRTNADAFKQDLAKFLATLPIKPGTNTVVSAHENTLRNHPDLFDEGKDLVEGPMILETGLYVLKRTESGKLSVVQKYYNLGEVAANGIQLSPKGPLPDLAKTSPTPASSKL